jgi:hypothetical protein
VLNKYTTSQSTVVSEAGALRSLYYRTEQFPQPQRDQIQELLISYGRVVVDEEWPLMHKGQTSPKAEQLDQEITMSIHSFEPNTSAEQTLYAQALQRVHDLNQNRDTRLLYAQKGLPPIMWVVVVVLAVTIVLFTYIFGMESARLHWLAVAVLTAALAFTLFTIIVLDQPFGGDLRVGPEAFEIALKDIGSSKQGS